MNDTSRPALLRALGRWDLVALVINSIIGAGIFGLPAKVHALLGAWGILAIIACAVLIGCVLLCFAEVSSRFTETGGPYLYAAEAFGPFAGFVVGWLLWLARLTGICTIIGVLIGYLTYFLPAVGAGVPRALVITGIVLLFTGIHISGVRRAAMVGNVITVAKLIPLLLFVVAGIVAVDPALLDFRTMPRGEEFSSAVLLLGFAFVGWETAVVAAGELRDPRRDTPFALGVGLLVVVLFYVGIQAVCVGTLPTLATSERPLADAALRFLGPAGATLIVVGAVVSMLGTINGASLAMSRLPFAMAEAGQLPRSLARLHPGYRTPVVAIVLSSVLVLVLTLTSTFVYVLTISTIARLLVFAATCVALPVLRRRPDATPALFTLAGGITVPALALALIVWLLASTSWRETRDVLLACAAGAVLHLALRERSPAREVGARISQSE